MIKPVTHLIYRIETSNTTSGLLTMSDPNACQLGIQQFMDVSNEHLD